MTTKDTEDTTCQRCGGMGEIPCGCGGGRMGMHKRPCPTCNGTGKTQQTQRVERKEINACCKCARCGDVHDYPMGTSGLADSAERKGAK